MPASAAIASNHPLRLADVGAGVEGTGVAGDAGRRCFRLLMATHHPLRQSSVERSGMRCKIADGPRRQVDPIAMAGAE
jgi:hypothetical protein